jgi:hypothetical protein
MHTPPAPPTDTLPSAQERGGQQRQQRWRCRQHCQAAAGQFGGQLRPGEEHSQSRAKQARSARELSVPVRAADVLSGGAADVRSRRHAAEGLQPMGEAVRAPGGTLMQQCFQPMS